MAPTASTDPEVEGCPSIQKLIATHPRERLFVHPLLWTARHLELLGCEFLDRGIITTFPVQQGQSLNPAAAPWTPLAAPVSDWLQEYLAHLNSDVRAADFLATSGSTRSKQNALSRLLGGTKECE